jgi:dTDP-4-dehydrorhamnose 3,5-epimerase
MKAFVIPEGCAHGFQSMEENIEMVYMSTMFYRKDAEDAIKYDEPRINISWPIEVVMVSEKDSKHPYLSDSFKGI